MKRRNGHEPKECFRCGAVGLGGKPTVVIISIEALNRLEQQPIVVYTVDKFDAVMKRVDALRQHPWGLPAASPYNPPVAPLPSTGLAVPNPWGLPAASPYNPPVAPLPSFL